MITEEIFMPNEIFDDLQTKLHTSKHISYAYAYYYYCSYLYRYCYYVNDDNSKMTQKEIKKRLGYSETNLTIDFIIKKGGVLDELGYTETTTNYPIMWNFYESAGDLRFYTVNDLKMSGATSFTINDRNFRIKYPVKAFYRMATDLRDGIETGTFYDVSNTHRIPFAIFEKIITDEQLGAMGFYLYGYLKHKTDIFYNGYQASQFVLQKGTGIGTTTIKKLIKKLVTDNYVKAERRAFHLDAEEREANLYYVY